MKNIKILFPFGFLLIVCNVFSQITSQRDSIPAFKVNLLKTNYKDFVVIDKTIYAITNNNSLAVIDITRKKINSIIPDIYSIAKTSRNEFYFVSSTNEVSFTKDFEYIKNIDYINGEYSKILVDKNDDCVVITRNGIRYKNKTYIPKTRNDIYEPKYRSEDKILYFRIPDLAFIDSNDRIWLTYDNGEFGKSVWFFNLKDKEFYADDYLSLEKYNPNKMEYNKQLIDSFPDKIKFIDNNYIFKFPSNLPINNPVKGMSENRKKEIFISQSLMHFFVYGNLSIMKETKIQGFYNYCYLEGVLEYANPEEKNIATRSLKEYIGPNAYNPFDDCFYYYSDKGFFKIIEKDNTYSKELLFRPWIVWTAGLPNAVGYQMNVTKFEFISPTEMVFLTSSNGIGYFDGKSVIYFQ